MGPQGHQHAHNWIPRQRGEAEAEKEFRVMIVKMIQNLGNRMEAQIEKIQEIFNKDLEELKNKQR